MPDKKLASSGEQARHDEIEATTNKTGFRRLRTGRREAAAGLPAAEKGLRAGPVGV